MRNKIKEIEHVPYLNFIQNTTRMITKNVIPGCTNNIGIRWTIITTRMIISTISISSCIHLSIVSPPIDISTKGPVVSAKGSNKIYDIGHKKCPDNMEYQ